MIVALILLTTPDKAAADSVDIPLLEGGSVDLAEFEGQVVALNFWATWCPPCRAEMPELNAYYQEYQADGFVLLAINSGEPAATARAFIDQTGYVFPVGVDEDGQLTDEFGVVGLPTTIVIGADGEIVYRHSGLINRAVLDAEITPLLTGQ